VSSPTPEQRSGDPPQRSAGNAAGGGTKDTAPIRCRVLGTASGPRPEGAAERHTPHRFIPHALGKRAHFHLRGSGEEGNKSYGHHSVAAVIAMIYLCCGGITMRLPTER